MLRSRCSPAVGRSGAEPFPARGRGLHEHGVFQGVEHRPAAEQGFGCKLLRSTIGGSGGGGAQLTDEARQIMEAYDAYCRKLDAYGQELFRELFGFCTEK